MTSIVDGSSGVTTPALIPTGTSIPTNGIYLPSSNNIAIATNGVKALNIDGSQIVTLPKQPRFLAKLNGSTQSISSGANATPTYGNVIFDSTSSYNSSTYTYTAPVAGYYQFNGRVRLDGFTGSGNYGSLTLQTTGNTYNNIQSSSASYASLSISVLTYMAAGDTAYLFASSVGQTLSIVNTQPVYSDFSGYLVG